MAESLQSLFFDTLDRDLAGLGFAAVTQAAASNTGQVDVVRKGTFEVVTIFRYHFQAGHNVFESAEPIWSGKPGNPGMYIAKDAGQVGESLSLIVNWVWRQSRKSGENAGNQPGNLAKRIENLEE